MRTCLVSILLILLTFTLVFQEASAARFGGGRSFGVQRSQSSLFSPKKSYTAKPYAQRANKPRWGSMLGGLLIGGLLASLFMGHGLGTGLLTWLILGSLIFFLFNIFRKKMNPAFQNSATSAFRPQVFQNNFTQDSTQGHYASTPVDFNADSFLRAAKVTFFRLQAAYDQKNLQDLSEFTAPDVFAEIKMQLDERGDAANHTEITNLEAELLDVSKQVHGTIASVRFTGFVQENHNKSVALDEIWHFQQFAKNTPWLVAGLQQ